MRVSKKSASTTLKIRKHCKSNKSQSPHLDQEDLIDLAPVFCSDFLPYNLLSCSLHFSTIGLEFVSPICQASSCFKAVVYAVPTA